MSRRKVLGVGLVVAVVAILAVAAYLVMAQVHVLQLPGGIVFCGPYTPAGRSTTVGGESTGYICFPHNTPFRLVVGYMGPVMIGLLSCGATGYVMGSEIDCCVSWVGQNGYGTTTTGFGNMGSGATVLTVGPVTVQLESSIPCSDAAGYPGHNLQIVNSGNYPTVATLIY
jgi:hypothetical protein